MEPAFPMVQQIEELLNATAPTLAHVEDTLTEGYATALALEAERLRLQRRLGEVARTASADHADELRLIGSRLTSADRELERLRAVLGTLYDRARLLRAAAATAS
jgi:regulator of replication initiation timing